MHQHDDDDDQPIDRAMAPSIGAVIEARFGRRSVLAGAAGAAIGLGTGLLGRLRGASAAAVSSLGFDEIPHALSRDMAVAPGYDARVLLKWGDPVLGGAPGFDINALSGGAQLKQFGYNCDFIGFLPLPRGSTSSRHGLLCVNHEYTNWELMVPGLKRKRQVWTETTARQVAIEMAAHGHAVVEVRQAGGRWVFVAGGAMNRRLTATTPMRISGPAAGHARLRTAASPDARGVLGTINNCAGGTTPWGTVLIAEENIHYYFGGKPKASAGYARERANFKRMGVRGRAYYGWHRFERRFDVAHETNEMNRFGWIVEYDPYDPRSVPVKRTALGRFKHEGASVVLAPDGRVVAYMGDDQVFEYVYRFVSTGRFDAKRPRAARDLLDRGTLSVARFEADGTLRWLPLVHGKGPLTPDNGFRSQADVAIEARRAADLVGATPMDRPEEIEVEPLSGRVYLALTKNPRRGGKRGGTDAANPRAMNRAGHIIEIVPPGAGPGRGAAADHAADRARWGIFVLAGDPRAPASGARYHARVSREGWFANPDNFGFDPRGRIWVGTDQGPDQRLNRIADGVYAADTDGPGRALARCFFTAPVGAELCSPTFTPDGRTLFVAVQHPGEGSGFERPMTRWPDFQPDLPPRPSVVAITRKDGGPIGG